MINLYYEVKLICDSQQNQIMHLDFLCIYVQKRQQNSIIEQKEESPSAMEKINYKMGEEKTAQNESSQTGPQYGVPITE